MPPVANNEDKKGSNGDNKSDTDKSKTNEENSDKSENESEVRVKDKDSESDKRLDEGFVSDGSEKKRHKRPSEGSPKRPVAQDIYANLPPSPSRGVIDNTPSQVLQQVEVGDVINNNKSKHSETNGDRRPAPASTNIYGQFPVSPYKYSGPVTHVQPLQTVSIQETQDQVKRAKELNDVKRSERTQPQTKLLEQLHVSIPVQQLDIMAPIPVSPSHPPPSPPRVKPTPSKPTPKTSLTPKPVRLESLPSQSPSRSPKAAPAQVSPRPSQLGPKPSKSPSRSPGRERAPAPTPIKEATSPRPSRKDIPSRKDTQKTVKDSPKKSSKERKDSKERSLSKDRSPAQRGRQSLRKSSSEQSPAMMDLTYMTEPVSTAFPSSRNKAPPDFNHKLIALCRKGDWVGVDTVLKWAFKHNVEPDVNAVSENSGWSPLMYAVKENRIQIVEQLIDLGYPVNLRAKVSPSTGEGVSERFNAETNSQLFKTTIGRKFN